MARPDHEAVRNVGEAIRTQRISQGRDRAPVAIAAGINDRTLARIESGLQDDGITPYAPKPKTLLRILRHLGMDPETYFESLGYTLVPESEEATTQTDVRLLAKRLSELAAELAAALGQDQ